MSLLLRSLQPRLAALQLLPMRMPLNKKGGKDKGPKKTGQLSTEVATGCGIMKGEEDPKLLPDDQYPEWLFKMMTPLESLGVLEKKYEGQGLTMAQLGRLWRLKNKASIKASNLAKAKA